MIQGFQTRNPWPAFWASSKEGSAPVECRRPSEVKGSSFLDFILKLSAPDWASARVLGSLRANTPRKLSFCCYLPARVLWLVLALGQSRFFFKFNWTLIGHSMLSTQFHVDVIWELQCYSKHPCESHQKLNKSTCYILWSIGLIFW